MSLADLQAWLIGECQENLLSLTRRTVRTEIDNLVSETDSSAADETDWPRLLLAGSILARSQNRAYLETALRIATGAVTLSTDQAVQDAGTVLLSKLSNFRAVALAQKRNLVLPELDARLGTSLRIEAQRRQMEHAILVRSSGEWLPVNEFQQRFWNSADTHQWLSASAPTASGKTFLVLQWLVDQMRSDGPRVAVYLAPTRALVSEIEGSLAAMLKNDPGIEVSSLPLRQKYDVARGGGNKLLLVFTQERLHLLANVLGEAAGIDLLIVDEAHKIGDRDGSGILHTGLGGIFA